MSNLYYVLIPDVSKGDVVVIFMPMVIEAVIAMLACARLGMQQGLYLPCLYGVAGF